MKKKPQEETASEIFWSTILTALKICVVIFTAFTILSLISIKPDIPITQFNYPMEDN